MKSYGFLIEPVTANYLDWLFAIGICLFSFWGLYFYTQTLKVGRFSFIGAISPVAFLFSMLVSVLLYKEKITTANFVSMALVSVAIIYHQKENLKSFKLSAELLGIVLCSLFWGTSFVLYLIPIKKFGVLYFSVILECCVLVSSLLIIIIKEKRRLPKAVNFSSVISFLLIGLFVAAGSLLNNLSLTIMPVSLNLLVGFLFESVIIIFGLNLFNEKLNKRDWIFIVLVTLSSFAILF